MIDQCLVSPLEALQLIQGEVKDVGHVVVGGPAAGQLILQEKTWSASQEGASVLKHRRRVLHWEWHPPGATWTSSSSSDPDYCKQNQTKLVPVTPELLRIQSGPFS